MGYKQTTRELYREAAVTPDPGLCCTTTPVWRLPDLVVPERMLEMNYGCGTTVHPRDLVGQPTVLYVGVGGGMELLQFAYFSRKPGGVVGIDPVAEMREASRTNLAEAAARNPWLREEYVTLLDADALDLSLADGSVDVAAQNCLFNIFETAPPGSANGQARGDLERALSEMHRVLKPAGRLSMSDPVASWPIPEHLRADETLRAQCISGCLPYKRYIDRIVEAGFGSAEVRSRRPYRLLDRGRYDLDRDLLLESIEVCAFKVPVPGDGPCVFTGRTAIYTGPEASFDDGKGHVLTRDLPYPVCDKTAAALAGLGHPELTVTDPTWHYAGGGCC